LPQARDRSLTPVCAMRPLSASDAMRVIVAQFTAVSHSFI
jgi:hypothetical protein